MVAPDTGGLSTSTNETPQTGDEGSRGEIRNEFEVNRFHREGNKHTDIYLHKGWLTNVSLLEIRGTGVVHADSLKHHVGSHLLEWRLSHNLRLGPCRISPAHDAGANDGADDLALLDDVKSPAQRGTHESRTSVKQASML